ncbi:hypothetical protein QL285_034179 [Trifolium repens]|nr:hypothetical protein QL285_034179 [Trifolium repens]
MQGTAADVLQTVGHGATLTGSKPSQWRQQTCGPQCPGPCPKGGVLGAETDFFLKGGQCGKFCKNEGPFGKKIDCSISPSSTDKNLPKLQGMDVMTEVRTPTLSPV